MIIQTLITIFLALTIARATMDRNLYEILGVDKAATSKEIKSAYRRKARDTHPDKNKAIPAEKAAAAFREVVQAFEILSDPDRREYYDTTGRTEEEDEAGYDREHYHWHFNWHNQGYQGSQGSHLRDTWEAQQAQSRMMHVVSLEQLRMIMLDEDGLLERHFIVCFVKEGRMEATALNEMVFPYPFAGIADQEIWWEDILQTMFIRLTSREKPLAEFFGIFEQDLQGNQPIFVYGRAGFPLEDGAKLPRIQTADRDEMERFVWEHLKVNIRFINEHTHPVDLFVMSEDEPILMQESLPPGASASFTSALSNVWFARDIRVDDFKHPQERLYSFSDESVLIAFHVLSSEQIFKIPRRTCYDLSTDCPEWAGYGECARRGAQFEHLCPYSCGYCEGQEILYHLYEQHDEL